MAEAVQRLNPVILPMVPEGSDETGKEDFGKSWELGFEVRLEGLTLDEKERWQNLDGVRETLGPLTARVSPLGEMWFEGVILKYDDFVVMGFMGGGYR